MRRVVEIRYPIFGLTRSTNTGGERQTRRKVAALSRLLLFDDVGIHRCRARGATFQHLNRFPGWTGKDGALPDHAALCRRVAGEISHTHAAKRLRMMAQEHETRARRLEGVPREAEDDIGASLEMFKTEQTRSEQVTGA